MLYYRRARTEILDAFTQKEFPRTSYSSDTLDPFIDINF
jgi:hypothetical protein